MWFWFSLKWRWSNIGFVFSESLFIPIVWNWLVTWFNLEHWMKNRYWHSDSLRLHLIEYMFYVFSEGFSDSINLPIMMMSYPFISIHVDQDVLNVLLVTKNMRLQWRVAGCIEVQMRMWMTNFVIDMMIKIRIRSFIYFGVPSVWRILQKKILMMFFTINTAYYKRKISLTISIISSNISPDVLVK